MIVVTGSGKIIKNLDRDGVIAEFKKAQKTGDKFCTVTGAIAEGHDPNEIMMEAGYTIGATIAETESSLHAAASALGRKGGKIGGKSKSKTKQKASRDNGFLARRPHIVKLKKFVKLFPHELIQNEFRVKFDLEINGKKTTYNPDYYCPELKTYIEVTTSKPNISEQGPKWRAAIKAGFPLLVFWWEGENITNRFQ